MWKWIAIIVIVLLFIYLIRSRKTGKGMQNEPFEMLSGSIATSQLPEELQVVIKQFTCDPVENSNENIPDDYLVGQEQTKLLKQQDPAKYDDLKKKNLVVNLEFEVNGRTVTLESVYCDKAQDQGKCGSCWAFAIAASLSDRVRLYGKKGFSKKSFCFQGADDNPPACQTYCEQCLNSGCCRSYFCKPSGKDKITRSANSGWVEQVNGYRSGKFKIDNALRKAKKEEPKPKPKPVEPVQPRPEPPKPQPPVPKPQPVQPQPPTPQPQPEQIVQPQPQPVEPKQQEMKPISSEIFIPELLVEPMLWPLDPTKVHNYDDILKLEEDPEFTGNKKYQWIMNCISPYYLAACNVSNIGWELDSETANTIGKEVKSMLSRFGADLQGFTCSGGIPIFACIYVMLQGTLSLKDHNPYKRYNEYMKCSNGQRTDRCKEIMAAYADDIGVPSDKALQGLIRQQQMSGLNVLYVCEDCNPDKLPYYQKYEQCSEQQGSVKRYIQSQYFACKTVYQFTSLKDFNLIRRDIMRYGSVVLTMVVQADFYKIGMMDARQQRVAIDAKSYIYNGDVDISAGTGQHGIHAITIVGWIKADTPEGFVWIVRNSWSERWGNKGFCLMRHNRSNAKSFEVFGMEPFEYYDERDFISPDKPVEMAAKSIMEEAGEAELFRQMLESENLQQFN